MDFEALRAISCFRDAREEDWHRHKNPDGSVGGWVQNSAHVDPTVSIYDDAVVFGKAKVLGEAVLSGWVWVFGKAVVKDHAKLNHSVQVFGEAVVSDSAYLSGTARVFGKAKVCGHARVGKHAEVFDNAEVGGRAVLTGNARAFGTAKLLDPGEVTSMVMEAPQKHPVRKPDNKSPTVQKL